MKFLAVFAFVLATLCISLGWGMPAQDLQTAASGHHSHGHVQIKVYRGPDSGHGNEKDGHHAPFGYWVKQPADDEHHH
ncbi:Hypothetical predicted protein [Cloeon dipterum]|uniref:Uncharacterized protein n=1 Tax=Cloeon dipterum TaxID=197152 RepID=A0A8S1E417_9INSE|nr:Hypothetical predicted protein [Cloeon dipterum]CAB3388253.1 Hypothetical predicted protein [Cloeon dipterum]